jgi:hypothetical protein
MPRNCGKKGFQVDLLSAHKRVETIGTDSGGGLKSAGTWALIRPQRSKKVCTRRMAPASPGHSKCQGGGSDLVASRSSHLPACACSP